MEKEGKTGRRETKKRRQLGKRKNFVSLWVHLQEEKDVETKGTEKQRNRKNSGT